MSLLRFSGNLERRRGGFLSYDPIGSTILIRKPYQFKDLSGGDRSPYTTYVGRLKESNLFHSLPWLDFIVREHSGRLLLLEVRRDGEFYGYWPLISVRKMVFKLMGSPLRGWLTSHMGPLLEGPLEEDLVQALKQLCLENRIAYLEVAGNGLDGSALLAAGFRPKLRETWILDIEASESAQWDKLHYNCRKNIKKAERGGVTVSPIDGPEFFPRFYDLVVKTFRKKGLSIPFGYRRLELLQDTIGKNGQMIFLGAFHQNEFIGGHIWGHDHHTAYALAVGHEERLDPLRVTNMLIWEGIKTFIRMGLKKYDMYGGSRTMDGVTRFKSSFGSYYAAKPYFSFSFSPIFDATMFVYENWYWRARRSLRRRRLRDKNQATKPADSVPPEQVAS
jgi:GNAT acetyltransferase-like protein